MTKFLMISISCAWIGIAVFVYFYQSRLIFLPNKELTTTPADLGLAYVDVAIPTTDGEVLHAWFVPHPTASASVLFLHGNGGNISDRLLTLARLHEMQLNVLMLDYRGYGRSTGKPSAQGTFLDAQAGWNYLINEQDEQRDNIVVYGRSLGGAVAVELASRMRPRALIIESTFTSIADMASDIYPYLPTRMLLRHKYPSIKTIVRISVPLLVAHSTDDELIPLRHGQRLFEVAPEPKQFYRLVGSHNQAFTESGQMYYNTLSQFIHGAGDDSVIDDH
ncbi:MAG: alpha/beta hydrolase [Gammaproteobacteria bacterium]